MSTENDTPTNLYATAALKRRRSILAGELAAMESQARLKREALAHIDAVLRMFAPDLDPGAIPDRRPRSGQSYPIAGLSRRILGILRRHGAPMHLHDVADALVAEMGFPAEARPFVIGRARFSLRDLYKKECGSVVKTGSRMEAMWSLG